MSLHICIHVHYSYNCWHCAHTGTHAYVLIHTYTHTWTRQISDNVHVSTFCRKLSWAPWFLHPVWETWNKESPIVTAHSQVQCDKTSCVNIQWKRFKTNTTVCLSPEVSLVIVLPTMFLFGSTVWIYFQTANTRSWMGIDLWYEYFNFLSTVYMTYIWQKLERSTQTFTEDNTVTHKLICTICTHYSNSSSILAEDTVLWNITAQKSQR